MSPMFIRYSRAFATYATNGSAKTTSPDWQVPTIGLYVNTMQQS